MQFLGKEIKFAATRGFDEMYGGVETLIYVDLAMKVLRSYPVDMLIFESLDANHAQVRLAGYDFNTGELDEETVAKKFSHLVSKKFWLKIDDYGEHFVGTFLFPEEY